MIAVISAPSGSDLNPVRNDQFLQVPTVPERGPIEFVLAQPVSRDELVLALNAVVMQDGRLSGLSVIGTEPHPASSADPERCPARARAGPPGASPVAVNLVWLLAHTTVKASAAADYVDPGAGCRRKLRRPAKASVLYFFTSVTAVATLFIASIARMITLRPISLSSSVTSNSSRRESAMPSFG